MKCGARVALGVAGGYFLGRTKKMKLALMLAGMAAGRQAGGPGALLDQGKNLLNASPELLRLTDEVKGRLLDAGKGAALAVATRQVEALTDRVAGRVESSLGNLAERGRGSTNSSHADREEVDEVDDDDRACGGLRLRARGVCCLETTTATRNPQSPLRTKSPSTESAPVRRARRSQGSAQGNEDWCADRRTAEPPERRRVLGVPLRRRQDVPRVHGGAPTMAEARRSDQRRGSVAHRCAEGGWAAAAFPACPAGHSSSVRPGD